MNVLLIGSGGREHALAWAISASPLLTPALLRAGQCRHRRGGRLRGPRRRRPCRRRALLPRAATSASSWSGPRRRWWRASPTIWPRPGSRYSGPPRPPPSSRARRASPRTSAASSRIPDRRLRPLHRRTRRPRPIWRARSCRSSSRPTAWRPARAWSSPRPMAQAEAAVDACFAGAFGAAGAEIVIEEFLEGEEASFFALVDGEHVLPLATRPGPQARRRRRHRPQHRRHGRLFAGPRHDARDDRAAPWTRSSARPCAAWPRAARPSRACCSSAS